MLTRASEGDSLGLGRWNTIDIQSEQCKVRFVCAYRCVKSKETENTVYIQQLHYFQYIGRNICPIKAFAADFEAYLQLSLQ